MADARLGAGEPASSVTDQARLWLRGRGWGKASADEGAKQLVEAALESRALAIRYRTERAVRELLMVRTVNAATRVHELTGVVPVHRLNHIEFTTEQLEKLLEYAYIPGEENSE